MVEWILDIIQFVLHLGDVVIDLFKSPKSRKTAHLAIAIFFVLLAFYLLVWLIVE